jgi:hypothetical protein
VLQGATRGVVIGAIGVAVGLCACLELPLEVTGWSRSANLGPQLRRYGSLHTPVVGAPITTSRARAARQFKRVTATSTA